MAKLLHHLGERLRNCLTEIDLEADAPASHLLMSAFVDTLVLKSLSWNHLLQNLFLKNNDGRPGCNPFIDTSNYLVCSWSLSYLPTKALYPSESLREIGITASGHDIFINQKSEEGF